VRYLWQAVLSAQVFYPLVVTKLQGQRGTAAEAVKEIEALERQHLTWLCKALHLHHSFPLDLLRADFCVSGIGLESSVSKIGRDRAEVARGLEMHNNASIRNLWWHLPWADWGTNLASASGWCAVTQTMMHQCRMSWTTWLSEGRRAGVCRCMCW
jgi:hypothetical protein